MAEAGGDPNKASIPPNPLDGRTSEEIVQEFHPNTKDAFQQNFAQLTVHQSLS